LALASGHLIFLNADPVTKIKDKKGKPTKTVYREIAEENHPFFNMVSKNEFV